MSGWTQKAPQRPDRKKKVVWLELRLAAYRTGWNRCLPVQCCGFKQTLANAHAYTHVFIFAHTGSACFCFVGQAPQFLRSKRASATHTVTHCLCCRASCGLTSRHLCTPVPLQPPPPTERLDSPLTSFSPSLHILIVEPNVRKRWRGGRSWECQQEQDDDDSCHR